MAKKLQKKHACKQQQVKSSKSGEGSRITASFMELQALEPVEKGKIRPGIKALGCHLFMVEKFTVGG